MFLTLFPHFPQMNIRNLKCITYKIENCLEILQQFLGVLANGIGQRELQDGGKTTETMSQEGELLLVVEGRAPARAAVDALQHFVQLQVVRRVGEVAQTFRRILLKWRGRLNRRCRRRHSDL